MGRHVRKAYLRVGAEQRDELGAGIAGGSDDPCCDHTILQLDKIGIIIQIFPSLPSIYAYNFIFSV